MNHNSGIEDVNLPIMIGSDAPIPCGYFRFLLVRQGAVRLTGEDREYILLPRSVVLILPRTVYRVAPAAGAETSWLSFGRIALDPETWGDTAGGLLGMLGMAGAASAVGQETHAGGIRVIRPVPAVFEDFRMIHAQLEAEARERQSGFEAMQKLRLVELLMLFHRAWKQDTGSAKGGSAEPEKERFRIEDAVRCIQDRYAEELSLPELASRFGFNPSYFSRVFAKHTGVHLFEYVNRIRINKSCLLLKRSALSIVEIAFSVGYNNLSHFNRYFRRVMGTSPREYRRNSRR
jgi:AraC-like DNA-binding protein